MDVKNGKCRLNRRVCSLFYALSFKTDFIHVALATPGMQLSAEFMALSRHLARSVMVDCLPILKCHQDVALHCLKGGKIFLSTYIGGI